MILSSFLLAISLSLDAFTVGLVYSIKKINIPITSKIIICFLSILYAGISLKIGKTISVFLPTLYSTIIGVLILFVMGLLIIINSLLKSKNNVITQSIKSDADKSGTIDIRESLLLGLTLSMDSIGVSIGSALAGFYSMLIPFTIGLFQITLLCLGIYFGRKFASSNKINPNLIAILPGILLIILAILRIPILK